MKMKLQGVLLAGAVVLLAGCSHQRYEPIIATDAPVSERWTFKPMEIKYMDSQSPAWNFQHVLEHNVWHCGQEADMGYGLYRQRSGYGLSRPEDREQSLADCQQYAYQRGDEAIKRLQQGMPSPKVLELSKDLYAKWFVYISDMSISTPKNTYVQVQYETSKRALLAEDKFAK